MTALSSARKNTEIQGGIMPVFKRHFATKVFSEWYSQHPNSAVHELFRRWALPGTPDLGDSGLRLAVRAGYLNFYVKGQSVAKLSCGSNGPSASVHEAYIAGRLQGTEHTGPEPVRSYIDFNAEALANPATAGLVAGWIKTAESYASAEKRFVDDLVAANAGTIDLEMGLPASDLPGSEKVAPRMDLVIIQTTAGADPAIAFWEAKCANNSELRAKGEADPKVLGQVRRYVEWMAAADRVSEVQRAYRATAEILIKLHDVAAQAGRGSPDCLRLWEALAAVEEPQVVAQPGVVIGNYWPEGSTEGIASERMRQCALSFEKNGHREKLEQAGICVHQVGPDERQLVLRVLEQGKPAA